MARKVKETVTANDAAPTVNQFEVDGKKYIAVHTIIVHTSAGAEKLTAADICVHEEAQRILIASNSSSIREVIT